MDHKLLTLGSINNNQWLMELFTSYTPMDSTLIMMDGTSATKPFKECKMEPPIELMKMFKKLSNYIIWFLPLLLIDTDTILNIILEFSNMANKTMEPTEPALFLLPIKPTLILHYGMSLIFISMNILYGNHLDYWLSNF